MTTNIINCIYAGPVLLEDCRYMSETLRRNLRFVMTAAPTILETLVWLFQKIGESSVLQLTREISRIDLLGVDDEELYLYWMKQILFALAFGMPHDSPWNGSMPVTAVYTVLSADGCMDRFSIYEQRKLKELLLHRSQLVLCQEESCHVVNAGGRIELRLGAWIS